MLAARPYFEDDKEYQGHRETELPAQQFLQQIWAASTPRVNQPKHIQDREDGAPGYDNKITCGKHLVRSSNSKRAGRDSIAAQETFQIVHFLAGAGELAEPAAEFL